LQQNPDWHATEWKQPPDLTAHQSFICSIFEQTQHKLWKYQTPRAFELVIHANY
jgi:hypothetical protein